MDATNLSLQAPDDDNDEGPMTPREELHQAILEDVRTRKVWETRQVEFYKMRHNGLARQNKPWKNAADLHWPLIDTNIEKLKPLFFQQIFGMDVVATMIPMCQQYAAMTTTAEQWFDYKVRERTNLESESLAWIDYALMAGRGVLKVTWNEAKKQVQYDSVDPLYVIVPSHTKELQDADRFVHVMPMSVAAYKRSGKYDTKPDTVKRITVNSDEAAGRGSDVKMMATRLREGITHDSKNEKVIVWEVYERGEAGQWIMRTYSPVAPDLDLRDPMELPYDHGMLPFVDFAYEIKDKGWYSPRGIAEILAPFEAALCHTWNQKHDTMQLYNKPTYRAEREIPNTMNLRVSPGQILPYGISPNPAQQLPTSFDDELTNVRSIAEQRVANPDYGMGQVLDTKNRRTATEISAINGQSQQAGDLRTRLFRAALGRAYKMTWKLLIQYDKEDLQYRFQEDSLAVDVNALHEKYHIEPKGGASEVNRDFLHKKSLARLSAFGQSPYWDRAELEKSAMELDDPSLIKRCFRDPNLKGQDESEEESKNIPALLLGENIPVKQGQNYPLRVGVLLNFVQRSVKTQMPMTDVGAQAVVARMSALLQADAQVDNNGAKQLTKQVQDYLGSVGLLPQQQGPAAASNNMAQPPQL